MWLLTGYPPSVVGTYAYVHPLVAVFLGWLLADEQVTAGTVLALAMILLAIFLIRFAYYQINQDARSSAVIVARGNNL